MDSGKDNSIVSGDQTFGENMTPFKSARVTSELCIAWIDCAQLTRESLSSSFINARPHSRVLPFPSVEECVAQKHLAADLILLHCHADDRVDIAAIDLLRDAFGAIPLIVLSDALHCHPAVVRETLSRGVSGFILARQTGLQVVASAIDLVHSGGTFVPRDFLFTQATPPAPQPPRQATDNRRLTQRELAVLQLIQMGKPNKLIADDLGMSASTVKVHVRNIMQKMGVTNRTQVALSAEFGMRSDAGSALWPPGRPTQPSG